MSYRSHNWPTSLFARRHEWGDENSDFEEKQESINQREEDKWP